MDGALDQSISHLLQQLRKDSGFGMLGNIKQLLFKFLSILLTRICQIWDLHLEKVCTGVGEREEQASICPP